MGYIPFTEQQREQARRTDLAGFLWQCGEEVKKSGSENMWLDHGQKVTIRGNLWFHQYEQVGGDAIDFACRFYGMDYPEAVQLMLSMGVATVQGTVEPFARQPLELPPKHENMRRVYGYLIRRRGIDKDVLDAFAYRGLVYESADYHNAVFVGIDREGKPRHIHKHSTAAQGGFKGNAPGSEPEYSFHWIGGGDTLFLFEAPVDMLSFPRDDHAAQDIANWMRMEKPQAGYQERCYYHKFPDANGKASIYQPKLKKGLTISFDADKLDGFVEWKMMGVRDYVLGLECGNCYPDGRDVMRKTGILKFLNPGETIQYEVTIDLR